MASGYSDLSEIRGSGRAYGKPAKINLLDEKPRRESLVEQQLSTAIDKSNIYGSSTQYQQVGQNQQQVLTFNRSQDLSGLNSDYPIASSSVVYSHGPRNPDIGISERNKQTNSAADANNINRQRSQSYMELEAELTEKEARLKRELAYLNQYQYSPWSRPRQIREPRKEAPARVTRDGQRWVKECPSTPSSRPTSRASSTRSNVEADLVEKASKLLVDADELARKPLNSQQIVIDSGTKLSQLASSDLRVSSVHTAVIKEPRHEVNNKSPLPFAFDNFSTLGVRGNIASVGAAEPDTPYPPIFPTIKRTPSPINRRN